MWSLDEPNTKIWNFSSEHLELDSSYGFEINTLGPTTAYFQGDYIDRSEVVEFPTIYFGDSKGDDYIYVNGVASELHYIGFKDLFSGMDTLVGDYKYRIIFKDQDGGSLDINLIDGNVDIEATVGSINAEKLYRIDGNDLANTISGDSRNNTFRGNEGDYVIYGNGGDDDINGKDDKDQLFGGEGNDIIRGGNGDDILSAGSAMIA